jgi:hypothetical protein
MPRLLLVLVALTALAVGGCGGGGRLSKDAYAAKANAICADYNAKVKAIGISGTSLDTLAKYIDRVIPLLEDGLGRLKKLKPPEDEQTLADQWLEIGDQQLDLIKKARDAARNGNRAKVDKLGAQFDATNKQSRALARRLGATTCAQG